MDQLIESVQPGVLHAQLDPVRNKIKELLDRGVIGRGSFPTHRIRILRSHARQVAPDKFVPVASAVVERRQLAFAYSGRVRGETTRRVASPQSLVYYRDQWYLDAWDEGRDGLRTFSIDRMADMEILDHSVREIGEEELDALLTAGYGLFAGPAKHTARLRFTAERARWVADETWHPDQTGRFLPDGRYELSVPYSDERELVGEVLRHGPDVTVVGPASLVQAVRKRLERAAARYVVK